MPVLAWQAGGSAGRDIASVWHGVGSGSGELTVQLDSDKAWRWQATLPGFCRRQDRVQLDSYKAWRRQEVGGE